MFSSIDGHLGYFHLSAIINIAAMNSGVSDELFIESKKGWGHRGYEIQSLPIHQPPFFALVTKRKKKKQPVKQTSCFYNRDH